MSVRGPREMFRVIADGLYMTVNGDMETYWSVPPKRNDGIVCAFRTPKLGLVVRKSNFGGSNVPGHLRLLDGSSREAVANRLGEERFNLFYEHERALRVTDHADISE